MFSHLEMQRTTVHLGNSENRQINTLPVLYVGNSENRQINTLPVLYAYSVMVPKEVDLSVPEHTYIHHSNTRFSLLACNENYLLNLRSNHQALAALAIVCVGNIYDVQTQNLPSDS